MKKYFLVLFAVLILFLAGCASVQERRSSLSAKDATVSDFSQMRFGQLSMEKSLDVELGSENQIYRFPEGNSFFQAVQLPSAAGSTFITFQSYTSGILASNVNVLIPKFAFLDQARKLIETETASMIMRKEDYWRGFSFYGRVQVPEGTTYVVIYAADKVASKLIVITENGTRWPVALAPSGATEITLTSKAVAIVSDSGFSVDGTKSQLFVVSKVDGERISNAMNESAQASYGTGFSLNTVLTTRELPAKPLKLTLVGTHQTGAPIQALFSQMAGTFFHVEGEVDFTPEPGGHYVVKGELKKEGSSVWIEDQDSGRIVTEKVGSQEN